MHTLIISTSHANNFHGDHDSSNHLVKSKLIVEMGFHINVRNVLTGHRVELGRRKYRGRWNEEDYHESSCMGHRNEDNYNYQ